MAIVVDEKGAGVMRILISAFAFSPYRGSECAVGWNIARELSKIHEVTVIFGDVWGHCISRQEMQSYTGQLGDVFEVGRLRAVYVPPTRLIACVTRLHKFPGCIMLYYLAYNLWQRQAYKLACRLDRQKPFDAVHQLNMIGYREPGYLWRMGRPFFWGPVGGSVNEPVSYLSVYSVDGIVRSMLRGAVNWLQKRLLLRPRRAARVAKRIWAVTDADEYTICDIWGAACERMLETAAMSVAHARERQYQKGESLRIVWSGTHTYGKAMPILIRAIRKIMAEAHANIEDIVRILVLGKGPETGKWKRLTEKMGVSTCFQWQGQVSHEKALAVMNEAHILAFTSVKEGTPHVVLEALSLGLPVICHDACGMGAVVNSCCGCKVPLLSPRRSVSGFAAAIEDILSGKTDLSVLSRGALAQASKLTWSAKAKRISDAYEEFIK